LHLHALLQNNGQHHFQDVLLLSIFPYIWAIYKGDLPACVAFVPITRDFGGAKPAGMAQSGI
jgi:hypothetical protein